ncbi:hypothetical protein HHX47_DHR1002028 [Lentinula edodes]|nr:hypothetical protein HHX47_DHR1002028 [Lentinula edodes]
MSTSIPDTETLSKLSHLEVFDASGKKVRFGSLFENQTLYVSQLSSEFQKLSQVFKEANVDTIAIGCGDWQPIEKYSGAFVILGFMDKSRLNAPYYRYHWVSFQQNFRGPVVRRIPWAGDGHTNTCSYADRREEGKLPHRRNNKGFAVEYMGTCRIFYSIVY